MPGDPSPPAATVRDERAALALVERVRAGALPGDALLPLLRESHALYREMSLAHVTALRGWILHGLAGGQVSEQALPFILEELESGTEAYLVAAAARALRSAAPRPGFVRFLVQAVENIRRHDDRVSFARFDDVVREPGRGTTALLEIGASLRWLGAHAAPSREALRRFLDEPLAEGFHACLRELLATLPEEAPAVPAGSCCCGPAAPPPGESVSALEALELEDQDGRVRRFGDVFRGRPSFVVFFFTRCDNPNKCPQTVAKLARLQQRLRAEGLWNRTRSAAISYDPGYDLAPRLKEYGAVYGLALEEDHCLLRTSSLPSLIRYFGLEVNFVGSVVNRHRIEAFVLDRDGRIAASLTRLVWEEEDALAQLRALL